MSEAYLQAAFELKTMCDELSRRLLRWHWEGQQNGTMAQLAEHLTYRKQQAPDYFERTQSITGKTTWQQLDTTFCMRVLLDPGDGEEGRPLRLLSAAPRPVVARQACNGLRMARNAAAHATTLQDAAQAAAAFSEAVESLEDGYGREVFTSAELEKYRKAAARAVNVCRGAAQGEAVAPAGQASAARKETTGKGAAARSAGTGKASGTRSKPAAGASGSKTAGSSSGAKRGGSTAARKNTSSSRAGGKKRAPVRKKKKLGNVELLFLVLGAVVLLAALWLRGKALGLFGG